MEYSYANHIAQGVIAKLKPVTERIMVCGSLRRKKRTDIHDIDIVVIARTRPQRDMFGMVTGYIVDQGFVDVVNGWEKVKGEPTGRYTQRLLENGVKLEIGIANTLNFGCITMIRTGDADFSQMMVTIARQRGFHQRDGHLYRDDKLIPITEEKQYFEVLGVPYVSPEFRNKDAFKGMRL